MQGSARTHHHGRIHVQHRRGTLSTTDPFSREHRLTRGDDRNAHGAVEPRVVGGSHDDVGRAVVHFVRYPRGGLVHLEQSQVLAPGDVDQETFRRLRSVFFATFFVLGMFGG